MKAQDQEFLLEVLRAIEGAFEEGNDRSFEITTKFEAWGEDQRKLRLSASGKGARYHAHTLAGTPGDSVNARSRIKMDIGHMMHDYLRDVLAHSKAWTVFAREKTVTVEINGVPVEGHLDLILRDNDSGQLYLVDIKTTDHFGYVQLDPRNPHDNWWARAHRWTSGDFVFNAYWTFLDSKFKHEYNAQIESYKQGLENEGIHVDEVLFVVLNRNTAHIAVGLYEPEDGEAIRQARDQRVADAMAADRPEDLDLCYPAKVGSKPDVQCEYCKYTSACFDLKTRIYKGKPQNSILKIKD